MYPTAHFLSVIDMHSFSEQAITGICRWHFIALLFIHIIALSHTTVVDTVHESLLAREVTLLFRVLGYRFLHYKLCLTVLIYYAAFPLIPFNYILEIYFTDPPPQFSMGRSSTVA